MGWWFSHESSPVCWNDVFAHAILTPLGKCFSRKRPECRFVSLQEIGLAHWWPAVSDGSGQASSKKTKKQKKMSHSNKKEWKQLKERQEAKKAWCLLKNKTKKKVMETYSNVFKTHWPWRDKRRMTMKNVWSQRSKMGLSASSAGNKYPGRRAWRWIRPQNFWIIHHISTAFCCCLSSSLLPSAAVSVQCSSPDWCLCLGVY